MKNFCKNCGEELEADWDECPYCETPVVRKLICSNCGKELKPTMRKCPYCKTPTEFGKQNPTPHSRQNATPTSQQGYNPFSATDTVAPWDIPQNSQAPSGSTSQHGTYPSGQPQQMPELQSGDELIGQYRIIKKIGSGGSGNVYLAENLTLGEEVAIKAIPTFGNVEEIITVLVGEYKSLKQIKNREFILESESPIKLSHSGMDWVLLPMELADKTLRDWLNETSGDLEGRLEKGLDLFKQACKGVEAIHEAGLLHLDLKPENILLIKDTTSKEEKWQVKIADFGLTRGLGKLAETRPELLRDGVGTPAYMAPEQIMAAHWKDVSKSADIYALGMILFELLDGDLPYSGTAEQIKGKKRNKEIEIRKPQGKSIYVTTTLKCLSRKESERPESAKDIISQLTVNPEETKAYIEAKEKDSIEGWESYLNKWQEGEGIAEAERRLDKLKDIKQKEEKERRKKEAKKKEEKERRRQVKLERERKAEAARKAKVAEEKRKKEEELQKRDVEIEMVYVEGGSYKMGETGKNEDVEDFYIGKYPITQKQWVSVMGKNPSHFKGDDLPVESVSWHDCQAFIEKLNAKTGKYYRLPTEAEWEWAAKGGAKSRGYIYSGSDNLSSVGWYRDNSNDKTHPVGEKKPNELGIHDMSGNVSEGCEDDYQDQNFIFISADGKTSSSSPSIGGKVVRGGSYWDFNIFCSSDFSSSKIPDDSNHFAGFRIAKDL